MFSGWLLSIGFTVGALGWFGFAIARYTNTEPIFALIVLVLFSPVLQPQFIIFALVHHITRRYYSSSIIIIILTSTAWIAAEWVIPKLLNDTLGHGIYPSVIFRQFADIGGVNGITFLLIIINQAIALAITRRNKSTNAWIMPSVSAVLITALMAGYGYIKVSRLTPQIASASEQLRIGMIQSNIINYDQLRKKHGAYQVVAHVLEKHFSMSRVAIEKNKVDALLWSETVYPTTFGNAKNETGQLLDSRIIDFSNEHSIPLLFGTYDSDMSGEYNAAALVEPDVGLVGFYRKTNLFFLTEYIPPWLDNSLVRRSMPWVGRWQAGSGARALPLRLADGRNFSIQPLICLDDTEPQLAIDGARLGAQVLLTLSNDSWFSDYSQGANLHLALAGFRSIETRLPQFRVTQNGVSAAIDQIGNVVIRSQQGKQQLLVADLKILAPQRTLVLIFGDWAGKAGLMIFLILTIWPSAKKLADTVIRKSALKVSANPEESVNGITAIVFSPRWNIICISLHLVARFSLVGIIILVIFYQDNDPISKLALLKIFGFSCAVPEMIVVVMKYYFSSSIQINENTIIIEQRNQKLVIPVKKVDYITPSALPLPEYSLDLHLLDSNKTILQILTNNAKNIIDRLKMTNISFVPSSKNISYFKSYIEARSTINKNRLDSPFIKFFLFALVPAIPVFHLHQYIAYGGAFGEYYAYGLQAYLLAFAIWWASWIIYMAMFAVPIRVFIEFGSVLFSFFNIANALISRFILEWLGRILYYVGIPALLLARYVWG